MVKWQELDHKMVVSITFDKIESIPFNFHIEFLS